MTKKACELCGLAARMFCESDQASLCWDCDEKVHSANFLVAKHTRATLCHVCHSPTPWKASGPSIGRTVSVCGGCICRSKAGSGPGAAKASVSEKAGREVNHKRNNHVEDVDEEMEALSAHSRVLLGSSDERHEESDEVCHNGEGSGGDDEHSCSSDDYDDTDDDIDDDEDDENQVVPWTSTPPVTTTSCTSSSNGEEEDSFAYRFYSAETESDLKRLCDFPTLFRSKEQENINQVSPISSMSGTHNRSTTVKEDEEDDEFIGDGFGRPWKQRRVTESSMIMSNNGDRWM